MKCLKCGFEVQEDSKFCEDCGEVIQYQPQQSNAGNTQPKTSDPLKGLLLFRYFILSFAGFFLLFLILTLMIGGNWNGSIALAIFMLAIAIPYFLFMFKSEKAGTGYRKKWDIVIAICYILIVVITQCISMIDFAATNPITANTTSIPSIAPTVKSNDYIEKADNSMCGARYVFTIESFINRLNQVLVDSNRAEVANFAPSHWVKNETAISDGKNNYDLYVFGNAELINFTGELLWMLVVEESSGKIVSINISASKDDIQNSDLPTMDGMVYYACDSLSVVTDLSPMQAYSFVNTFATENLESGLNGLCYNNVYIYWNSDANYATFCITPASDKYIEENKIKIYDPNNDNVPVP